MSTLFFVLALISVGVGIIASVAVASFITRRGIKINYILWRLMFFKYLADYRRLTMEETGKTGPWHTVFVVAMVLSLVFVIIGIILR